MKLKDSIIRFLPLMGIVLLGLGLRIYHLDFFPLWRDEAFTRFYSESPLSYLWTTGLRLETNPPGYYTILHFWMSLFGTSEFALRAPSVIASTLAIALVYFLGEKLEGSGTGLLGALFMALAPIGIWYAQEARAYALLQLCVGGIFLGLAGFLFRPASVTSLAVYVVSAIGAVYTHDTAIFLIAACNLVVGGAALGKNPLLRPVDLIRWLIANGVLALFLLLLLVVMGGQIGSRNIAWIPPMTLSTFCSSISEVIGGRAVQIQSPHAHFFLLGFILALALRSFSPLNRRTAILLIQLPLIFIGILVLVSLKQPLFLPRVLVWLWIPLSPLLALILLRSPVRWAFLFITVLVFAAGLSAQLFPSHILKENWRAMIAGNQKLFSQSRLIVLNSANMIGPMAYYLPETVSRLRILKEDTPPPDFEESFLSKKFNITQLGSSDLLSSIASNQCVCVILVPESQTETVFPVLNLPPPTLRSDYQMPHAYVYRILAWNIGSSGINPGSGF